MTFAVVSSLNINEPSLFCGGFVFRGVESNPLIGAWYLYAAADQDWQRAIDIINENSIPRPTEKELGMQICN